MEIKFRRLAVPTEVSDRQVGGSTPDSTVRFSVFCGILTANAASYRRDARFSLSFYGVSRPERQACHSHQATAEINLLAPEFYI
jgi:hypothetical protein